MRAELTIRDAVSGVEQSVVVDGADDMTVDTLAELLRSRAPSSGPLFLGTRPLVGGGRATDLPALDGAIVTVNGPGATEEPLDGPRVWCSGGPDAGAVVPLRAEGIAGGRSGRCAMQVNDPAMSRSGDFGVISHGGTIYLSDVGSRNGVYLHGQKVSASAPVADGQRWFVGQSEFTLRVSRQAEAAVRRSTDGGLVMTRQYRSIATVPSREVDWPDAPRQEESAAPFPWLQVLLPLLFSGVMLFAFFNQPAEGRSPIFLVFACSSPLMILTGVFADRRRRARHRSVESTTYDQRRSEAERSVTEAITAELSARQRRVPGLGELLETARGRGARLWERRPRDEDYLELRVGTADVTATSITHRGVPTSRPLLRAAPVSVDLAELGCVGIYGPDPGVRAVARSLVAQIATLHGPDDVQLALLLRDAAHRDWQWARWLPHLRRPDGSLSVGLDADTIDARIAELAELVDSRDSQRRPGRQSTPTPSVVAVVEDASELRDNPSMSRILTRGPELGVFVIACEQRRAQLPQECRAALQVPDTTSFGNATLEVQAAEPVHPLRLDGLDAARAEDLARAVAPLRIAGQTSDTGASSMPAMVRLLDLVGHRDSSPGRLKATWDLGGRSTRLTIGQTASGPLHLDLKANGPHALVAGTTGAGKSQLLMSLVVALALENTPEDLSFVLVDFKGGGAFEDCEHLPHTARMVTNLGNGEAARTISALAAEANRRQALFAPFGADIDTYERARRAGDPRAVLKVPRLVIVVDEFRQLAEQHEELLKEFVNVATVGRSLGMHMVLATQRPSGVISPQIRANTELRIALRVNDPADSVDVIERADAATIARSAPGRAFVRTADELFEVQTAAVGLPVPGTPGANTASRVELRPWIETPSPPLRSGPGQSDHEGLETDLQVAVRLVRQASEVGRYEIPTSPVLPPLPDLLLLGALSEIRSGAAPIGLEDRPQEQLQVPFEVHPADGHLLVAGTNRSGRTSLLRTLVASLACTWEPDDLHVYGFDFGGGHLRGLECLPHVGTIVLQNQPERARRLVARLSALVQERMRLFQQQGVGDLVEQRASGNPPLPYVSVLVDRWDVLLDREQGGGEVAGALRRLITEGAAFGISVYVTSDGRRARSLVSDISNTLCLTLNEKTEYSDFGIPSRQVPDHLTKGRALRGGEATEVQIALLASDPAAGAQNAAIEVLAGQFDVTAEVGLPFRVDELPVVVTMADLQRLPRTAPDGVPLAAGGDTLQAYCWSPPAQPIFVVTGPRGSGRTTVLETAVEWLSGSARIAVVDPDAGRLSGLEAAASVQSGTEGRAPRFDELRTWDGPVLLVIDDAERIMDDQRLVELLADRPSNVAVLCAANADSLRSSLSGALSVMARSRHGVLLNPQGLNHRGLLGLNSLDRSDTISDQPGRGLWVSEATSVLVQTARR
jgi:S-DNA-T family DNA segregation ATPase FtsK/SpoIIIE